MIHKTPEIKEVKITNRIYLAEIKDHIYFLTIVDSDGEILIHEYLSKRQLIGLYEKAGQLIRNEI